MVGAEIWGHNVYFKSLHKKLFLVGKNNILSPKNKVTNKQNSKHVYIEQQIHFPNFTLA
jgi:hypothetical protein